MVLEKLHLFIVTPSIESKQEGVWLLFCMYTLKKQQDSFIMKKKKFHLSGSLIPFL